MRTLCVCVCVALLAAASGACGKKQETPAKADDKPAAAAPAKPADSGAGKPATAPAGSVGVAECDDYVAKYTRCIDKMPADTRKDARDAMNQTVDAWKQAYTSPEQRAELAAACKAAVDTQKRATQSIGCEW